MSEVAILPLDPFRERVFQVRGLWAERRAMRGLHGRRELSAQLDLFNLVCSWISECADDVLRVYGDAFPIGTELRDADSPEATFELLIEGRVQLACGLRSRPTGTGLHWRLCVSTRTRRAALVSVGPDRRTGYWTRAAVEDLVLEALALYERGRPGAECYR